MLANRPAAKFLAQPWHRQVAWRNLFFRSYYATVHTFVLTNNTSHDQAPVSPLLVHHPSTRTYEIKKYPPSCSPDHHPIFLSVSFFVVNFTLHPTEFMSTNDVNHTAPYKAYSKPSQLYHSSLLFDFVSLSRSVACSSTPQRHQI